MTIAKTADGYKPVLDTYNAALCRQNVGPDDLADTWARKIDLIRRLQAAGVTSSSVTRFDDAR